VTRSLLTYAWITETVSPPADSGSSQSSSCAVVHPQRISMDTSTSTSHWQVELSREEYRPDISRRTSMFQGFSAAPKKEHAKALKWLGRYLTRPGQGPYQTRRSVFRLPRPTHRSVVNGTRRALEDISTPLDQNSRHFLCKLPPSFGTPSYNLKLH
jgi:hypothetical protein